jgi:hypothetical protein
MDDLLESLAQPRLRVGYAQRGEWSGRWVNFYEFPCDSDFHAYDYWIQPSIDHFEYRLEVNETASQSRERIVAAHLEFVPDDLLRSAVFWAFGTTMTGDLIDAVQIDRDQSIAGFGGQRLAPVSRIAGNWIAGLFLSVRGKVDLAGGIEGDVEELVESAETLGYIVSISSPSPRFPHGHSSVPSRRPDAEKETPLETLRASAIAAIGASRHPRLRLLKKSHFASIRVSDLISLLDDTPYRIEYAPSSRTGDSALLSGENLEPVRIAQRFLVLV